MMASRADSVTEENRSYDAWSRADLSCASWRHWRRCVLISLNATAIVVVAANRHLSHPVAGGDIACRRGDVPERAGHPPAEDDAGRDGEEEDHPPARRKRFCSSSR